MKVKTILGINLLLILALLLGACGTPAASASKTLKDLLALCADQKCPGDLAFAFPDGDEIEVFRAVTGPGALDDQTLLAIKADIAARNVEYENISLVAHAGQNDFGCGGLKACKLLESGGNLAPSEFAEWANTSLSTSDARAMLIEKAALVRKYFPNAQVNTYILINETQVLVPVTSSGSGGARVWLSEEVWKAWPSQPLPVITSSQVDIGSVRFMLQANEAARPMAVETIRQLMSYPHAQPFEQLFVVSRLEWNWARVTSEGFTTTWLPGMDASSVISELAYGGQYRPGFIRLVGRTAQEMEPLLAAMNQSPTFSGLISDSSWKGFVTMEWLTPEGRLMAPALRIDGQDLMKLAMPRVGKVVDGLTVEEIPLVLSQPQTAESVADDLVRAGIPAESAVVEKLVTLPPGVAIKALGAGVLIGQSFQFFVEDNYLYGIGGGIMLPSMRDNPGGGEAVTQILNDPRTGLIYSAPWAVTRPVDYPTIPSLLTIRNYMYDQQTRGESPCLQILQDDWSAPGLIDLPFYLFTGVTNFGDKDKPVGALICPDKQMVNGEMTTLVVINTSNTSERIIFVGTTSGYVLSSSNNCMRLPIVPANELFPEYNFEKILCFDKSGLDYQPHIENEWSIR